MERSLPETYVAESNSFETETYFPGKGRNHHPDTDALIMRVIEDDDHVAFQTLFDKMYTPLCHFCIKFVRSPEVAEELVSDVFYNIWKNRNRLIVSSPKAYLFASVRNKGFDHLRKIRKMVHCDLDKANHLPADTASSQDILVLQELTQSAAKSIARLPRQCRLVYELSRDQGLKYKEIAAILKVSVKTVETQMGRALKAPPKFYLNRVISSLLFNSVQGAGAQIRLFISSNQ